MVDMIYHIRQKYQKLIRCFKKRNGVVRKVVVGKVTKGIYGTLLGTVLFDNKLKGVLAKIGFEMNHYDKCTLTR